nr:hepatocyte cell adhesion molecule-like [Misgurnus anguillicaudatus]
MLQNHICRSVLLYLCWWRLDIVFGDEVKSVLVMEGDCVTLHTDITELQEDDVIEWMFGVESPDKIIAEFIREDKTTSFNDERFKNHLYVNHQTGDLIITNVTNKHTGVYRVEINRQPSVIFKHFNLTVYARLPVPVISSNSSQCLSSSSNCVLLCSVLNVRDVSLSWYKGNSLLSSISVSDLNIRLSLHLEVEYQDTNTYRCVVNNPITKQTQHLYNIKNLCQTCSDGVDCCGFTETVIRLVVSVLVGVAAVAF